MPAQIHIGRETTGWQSLKRPAASAKPVTFGKRTDSPAVVARMRPFSLSGLTGLLQGPRKTSRTNAR